MTTAFFFFNLIHISNHGIGIRKETSEVVGKMLNPIFKDGRLIGTIVYQMGD